MQQYYLKLPGTTKYNLHFIMKRRPSGEKSRQFFQTNKERTKKDYNRTRWKRGESFSDQRWFNGEKKPKRTPKRIIFSRPKTRPGSQYLSGFFRGTLKEHRKNKIFTAENTAESPLFLPRNQFKGRGYIGLYPHDKTPPGRNHRRVFYFFQNLMAQKKNQ